ncbi:MAG TPA: LysR substrate-binding domain-containing protein [Gaiellaceae bacterium]|nr:LysR substrate-binding domain-containing protein [Gaiellaceae bacterium]
MINVGRLLVLREVALRGSLAAAARSLSFTPSAVSQQLAALEREIGVPLLERQGRGVRLTDAAWALVGRSEAILAELASAEADIQAIKLGRSGTLALGAFPTAGALLVPAAIRTFAADHPDVKIELTELEPEESLPMLRRGELDVVVASEYDLVPLEAVGYEQRTLLHEPMLLVHGPARARLADPVRLTDLRGERWIAPPAGTAIFQLTVRACENAGFEPEIASTWTDFQVVQSLAAENLGVAFVPSLALTPRREGVGVRRTRPALKRRVFLAWRTGTAREPLIASMSRAFRAAAVRLEPSLVALAAA